LAYLSSITAAIRRSWKILTPALLVSIAIPLWQTYWVQTPDVHIEVTQVDRKPLDTARMISTSSEDSLRFLADRPNLRILAGSVKSIDVDDVEKLVTEYERENITNAQKYLNDMRSQLEAVRAETLTWDQAKTLNEFGETPEVVRKEFDQSRSDVKYASDIAGRVKTKLQIGIKEAAASIDTAAQQISGARVSLKAMRDRLDNEEARIIVGCAVSNAGRGSVSLRREGVLRVFLGSNNYIDADLTMDEYAANADLQPKHSRIIVFSSAPIRTFESAVRDRIKAYWGQNVPCKLYVTDIDGKIYGSDTFPFAQGLYQQLIYDKLREAASHDRLSHATK
jgi:hypothetical protein